MTTRPAPKFESGKHSGDRVLTLPRMVTLAAPAGWPTLDDRALHGYAGIAVNTICAQSEASPAAVLFQFLARLGATVGSKAHIPVGDCPHPGRLFVSIVGQTAHARKGTSERPVDLIFTEAEAMTGCRPLHVYRGNIGSGEGIVYAVRDPSERLDDDGNPIDSGVDDKRLLVIDEEIAGTLRAAARDGSTASAILRQSWDRGDLGTLTKHHHTQATGAHVSVIGHITAHELKTVLSKSDVFNGLANRFLWICARRTQLVPFPEPMDSRYLDRLARQLGGVVQFAKSIGPVTKTKDARATWSRLYPELTKDDTDPMVAAVSARAEAQVLRMALLYALLDETSDLDRCHIIAAAAAWAYAEQSVRFLFESNQATTTESDILNYLRDGAKSLSDINSLFRGHTPADVYRSALKNMEAAGSITRQSVTGDSGGRPSTHYSITPAEKAEKAEKQ